jgi:hypothetical protein
MMTRRDAACFALGIPLGAAVGEWSQNVRPVYAYEDKEFWNTKPPEEWTNSEIHQLLTLSPWAKSATVTNTTGRNGPLSGSRVGGGGRRVYAGGIGSGGTHTASGTNPSGTNGDEPGSDTFKAIVRWESALPVRQALRKTLWADAEEYYIIALTGGIPAVGIPTNDDDASERKQKLEALQDTTRIERRKDQDPLTLRRAESVPGGILFYFLRAFELKPDDRQVTFVTKLGPADVKCRFIPKEMLYRGKLDI